MHEEYMRQALALAQEAAAHGEVPVGCVIVREGRIVGRGRNRREEKQHTSSHAEMEAIRQANEVLGTWRLDDCTLYVTLEPCPMCAGAILNARIPRVYYGARDREMGACGGVLNLFMEDFPHPPALVGGVLAEDCRICLGSPRSVSTFVTWFGTFSSSYSIFISKPCASCTVCSSASSAAVSLRKTSSSGIRARDCPLSQRI